MQSNASLTAFTASKKRLKSIRDACAYDRSCQLYRGSLVACESREMAESAERGRRYPRIFRIFRNSGEMPSDSLLSGCRGCFFPNGSSFFPSLHCFPFCSRGTLKCKLLSKYGPSMIGSRSSRTTYAGTGELKNSWPDTLKNS